MLLIPRPSILRRALPASAVRMKVPLHRGVSEGERTVVLALQANWQHGRLRNPRGEFGRALVPRSRQSSRATSRDFCRRWRHGGRTPIHQKRQNDRQRGRGGSGHQVPHIPKRRIRETCTRAVTGACPRPSWSPPETAALTRNARCTLPGSPDAMGERTAAAACARNIADTQDLVQETLLQTFKRIESLGV